MNLLTNNTRALNEGQSTVHPAAVLARDPSSRNIKESAHLRLVWREREVVNQQVWRAGESQERIPMYTKVRV